MDVFLLFHEQNYGLFFKWWAFILKIKCSSLVEYELWQHKPWVQSPARKEERKEGREGREKGGKEEEYLKKNTLIITSTSKT
jgi:hypothetical protein